ncbi:hypothetical protein T45_08716 [Streptomyces turgidiscabies]|nr:hypothetical protein T45_08716 [Streptomyces turgidiscabies]
MNPAPSSTASPVPRAAGTGSPSGRATATEPTASPATNDSIRSLLRRPRVRVPIPKETTPANRLPATVSVSSPPGPWVARTRAVIPIAVVTTPSVADSRRGCSRVLRIQSSARDAVTAQSTACTHTSTNSQGANPASTCPRTGSPIAVISTKGNRWNDQRVYVSTFAGVLLRPHQFSGLGLSMSPCSPLSTTVAVPSGTTGVQQTPTGRSRPGRSAGRPRRRAPTGRRSRRRVRA